jgi:hypothetical protein
MTLIWKLPEVPKLPKIAEIGRQNPITEPLSVRPVPPLRGSTSSRRLPSTYPFSARCAPRAVLGYLMSRLRRFIFIANASSSPKGYVKVVTYEDQYGLTVIRKLPGCQITQSEGLNPAPSLCGDRAGLENNLVRQFTAGSAAARGWAAGPGPGF